MLAHNLKVLPIVVGKHEGRRRGSWSRGILGQEAER